MIKFLVLISAIVILSAQETIKDLTFDMNGDGTNENITVKTNSGELVSFKVYINDKLIHTVSEHFIGLSLEVEKIDLDIRDNFLELMILVKGAVPVNQYWIYNFIEKPQLLKKVYSAIGSNTFGSKQIKINNYGSIYTKHWMNFWEMIEKYEFRSNLNILSKVEQPFYSVGVVATPTKNVEFFTDMNGTNKVGKFSIGKPVTILLYKKRWYLIRSHLGLIGWVHEDAISKNFSGLNWGN